MSTESPTGTTSSGTLTLVQPVNQRSAGTAQGYGRLWRGVPRELGFLLLAMPIAVAGLSILNGLFWPGIGTIVIWVGLFVTLAALYVARAFGTVELVRLRWGGRPEITRPVWHETDKPAGFWRATFGPFANGHYWLYLLHGLVINPIVSIFSWTVTIAWLATGLGGVSYWFWSRFIDSDGQDFFLSRTVFGAVFPGVRNPFDPVVGDAVLQFVLGLIFLASLPFITRGLTLLHTVVARGLLGAWRSESLQREVADLSASRGAAIQAEDQSLRRLERDIHDGPQQRLVRLQMDISSAGRKIESDPDAARRLLAEASAQAGDALEELRALSRGFAPPILQDRGLVAGVESLAARSTVPATFDSGVPADARFTPEIERSAYFIVAELLTNVAKHSGARAVRVSILLRDDPLTGAGWLDLWVSDNGTGGASIENGHGLGGLVERVHGLRGTLNVDSPIGGPTQVSAHIPLPR
jgi:signal transduction histidine kinase